MGKKVLAIIPARGGSRRLPDKNIKLLDGKPLIAWTIEAAKKAHCIDKLIVSTDSTKIAEISKQYGAEIPFIRPQSLSNDTSSSIDVILHAVNYFKVIEELYEYIILLQPTSPLRSSEDINNAFKILNKETLAIISVCESEHSPLWSNTLPADLSMKNFLRQENKNVRSQDLPKYYRLNGAIYISKLNYFIKKNGFLAESTKAFVMPVIRSVDIDNEIDFLVAEALIKMKNGFIE